MPVHQEAPHVVIIGGYLTEPLFYRPMRSRLLQQGAARVTITSLHLPDWLAMGLVGMGPVMLRGARAIREARHASAAPLIVIGHSAGGLVARLAMSPEPFDGRRVGVADDVACLVTLGTPHRLLPTIPWWRQPGLRATEFLEAVSPGAFFSPTTSYLTVGSTLIRPATRRRANSPSSIINRVMQPFVGEEPGVGGDGIVGNGLSQLDGAPHIALPDALHGTLGTPWYGDAQIIDRWWPETISQWQSALATRKALEGSSAAAPSGSPR